MRKLLCCVLCLCLVFGCLSLSLADSNPLIYKVSDGEGRFIFLLGTMHVINDETLPIAHMDELMDQVDTAVFELGSEFFEALKAAGDRSMAQMLEDAATDEENTLSEALIEKLVAFFTEDCGCEGIDAALLRRVHAYDLYTAVLLEAMRAAGMDVSGAAVDKYVYGEAIKRGMTVLGAETVAEQLDAKEEYFGNILQPGGSEDGAEIDEAQFDFLMNNLSALRFSMGILCSAYNSGNRDLLMALVINSYPRSDVDAVRNQRFFDAAREQLDSGGKAVIAVGLYHVLCEEDGLVTRLTEAGYSVERWQPNASY